MSGAAWSKSNGSQSLFLGPSKPILGTFSTPFWRDSKLISSLCRSNPSYILLQAASYPPHHTPAHYITSPLPLFLNWLPGGVPELPLSVPDFHVVSQNCVLGLLQRPLCERKQKMGWKVLHPDCQTLYHRITLAPPLRQIGGSNMVHMEISHFMDFSTKGGEYYA